MVKITKSEGKIIREKVKDIKLAKTCTLKNNGSSRGVFYLEETKNNLNLLNENRNSNVVYTYGKVN